MRSLLAALLLALAAPLRAADILIDAQASLRDLPREPALQAPVELRFLSYNVHGVIPWILSDEPKALALETRYREMGRRLKALRDAGQAPQLVALQEYFLPTAHALVQESGYPYVKYGAGSRWGKPVGAGLVLLSEYPILSSETVDYKTCTGFDCFANKGALHVRVMVPGLEHPVDVFNTHLNADEPPTKPEDSLKARMAQLPILQAFIASRSGGGPVLIAGDFNFFGGTVDYRAFQSALGLANTELACGEGCLGSAEAPGYWKDFVDHHFILPSEAFEVSPLAVRQTFTEPWKGKPLSDHWGLEVLYRLSPRPSR